MTNSEKIIVGVAGAGAMGGGIAQVAAQAGHKVLLFDAQNGAAKAAKLKIAHILDGLVSKDKLKPTERDAITARLIPVTALEDFAPCGVVVEAIVEDLAIKRELFGKLEAIVANDAILASNTSSISITALARGTKNPGRIAGMHFFNPAPVMRLVEIVSGLGTARETADALFALGQEWGKSAVHARSTPGFIVNRIARPFYAEALALLLEKRATPDIIDACLRAAGFRMGPCEVMDLIGHDVNFAVTHSIFDAYFGDRRFLPSLIQRELVDGGLLGRKSGRGFYTYNAEGGSNRAEAVYAGNAAPLDAKFTKQGMTIDGMNLLPTDGRAAAQRAREDGNPTIGLFDWIVSDKPGALAVSFAPSVTEKTRGNAMAAVAAAGFTPVEIEDTPGLIVARTLCAIINEAADAVQQGVCDEAAANTAMKLGVNYPAGPFEWLERSGAQAVIKVLSALSALGPERYRPSPRLLAARES